jgi:hypothetical protein
MIKRPTYQESLARQITVAQLIELLKQQPPDAKVWHEDEYGRGMADGVEYDQSEHSVTITRSNY